MKKPVVVEDLTPDEKIVKRKKDITQIPDTEEELKQVFFGPVNGNSNEMGVINCFTGIHC